VNSWQPIETAQPDGTQCELRFRDALGLYEAPGPFFLHDDGQWYLIDPPRQVDAKPVAWKPAQPTT
jgi:hypothetical protein